VLFNLVRDPEIVRLREQEGVPVDEIAARFGVSRRTVFRVLSQHQAGLPRRQKPPGNRRRIA
jgi:predicted DNA-binding protein (UPF0251 family)